jgi:hypothetical protein
LPDDEHLRILKRDVETWNKWRASNPRVRPNLAGADLTLAKLTDADFTNVNLAGASLTRANLAGATLAGANLEHANLRVADLTGADLTGANLTGAGFTGASLGDANFTGAQVNSKTQGLDDLSDDQREGLVHVDRDRRAAQITFGTARHIIGPAHEVLIGLLMPDGMNQAHSHLILELIRTVEDLKRELAKVNDQNKLLSEEIEALKLVQKGLPVWRETWTTFIAAAAGGAAGNVGASAASYTAGYTAGFIAGVLHDTFSPDSLCIMT